MRKEVIATTNAPGAVGPYSQGWKLDSLIFTSGQIPLIPGTSEMPQGIEEQTRQALKNVEAILKEAGSEKGKIVKTLVLLDNMDDFAAMNEVYAEFFEGCDLPARSCFEVARLPKGALVEIEVIALAE